MGGKKINVGAGGHQGNKNFKPGGAPPASCFLSGEKELGFRVLCFF